MKKKLYSLILLFITLLCIGIIPFSKWNEERVAAKEGQKAFENMPAFLYDNTVYVLEGECGKNTQDRFEELGTIKRVVNSQEKLCDNFDGFKIPQGVTVYNYNADEGIPFAVKINETYYNAVMTQQDIR